VTVWVFGSINVDHVYRVPRIPLPGETLAASGLTSGLGGKGANQAVAAARAGAATRMIGAVGRDGGWTLARLAEMGVDADGVAQIDAPTGHAIIAVSDEGENAIIILGGANRAQSVGRLERALAAAASGDILLIQNETDAQPEAARLGRTQGMRVIYSAAPFDAEAVQAVLPEVDILAMNEGEAAQLEATLCTVPQVAMLVTLGAAGARWQHGAERIEVPAPRVEAIDTTGAGDTFAGYIAAALDGGAELEAAMRLAAAAAALQVTRPGAAEAIPTREEVRAFAGF
jgi:ribokinase